MSNNSFNHAQCVILFSHIDKSSLDVHFAILTREENRSDLRIGILCCSLKLNYTVRFFCCYVVCSL